MIIYNEIWSINTKNLNPSGINVQVNRITYRQSYNLDTYYCLGIYVTNENVEPFLNKTHSLTPF